MRRKIFIILVLELVVLTGLINCFAQVNSIVAKVNNEIITLDDLDQYSQMLLRKKNKQILDTSELGLKKEALKRLIEDKLILQKAKEEDIEAPQSWLENKIEQLASNHKDRESFYDSLKKQGLTITYLKERLSQQYLIKEIINRKVKSEVSVLPGKIEQFYKKNKEKFQSLPRAIFFIAKGKNKKDLEDMSVFIKKEGIEEAVKKYKDKLSEISSYLNQLQEPLSAALESLQDRQHLIKRINNLYYLIYRKKIEPPQALSLSEAQDSIYKHLWQKKFSEKFDQWVNNLKKDAVIKVYSFLNSQKK
ncbi:MAG: SurA N-terminal domain-containing protein [Candidatus Omnitrophica bacterium]|nr:SurA N-terminal domain-containing protein [Candidatus Omnitrophota bacterium]MCF7893891.1 SurA N-terminal domain-containing protein [Candidatus Omnitrophota bacterium]